MTNKRESFNVWRNFTKQSMALACAEILERVTGDKCTVVSRGTNHHEIMREDASGKMVRA